jgi:hypothetical protein
MIYFEKKFNYTKTLSYPYYQLHIWLTEHKWATEYITFVSLEAAFQAGHFTNTPPLRQAAPVSSKATQPTMIINAENDI